jgi:hypothetical protein
MPLFGKVMPVFNNCPLMPPPPRLSLCCVGFGVSGVILLHLLPGFFFASPLHIFLVFLKSFKGCCAHAVSSGAGLDEYSLDDYDWGVDNIVSIRWWMDGL